VREIRMLRLMRRALETESWDGLRHRQGAKAAGNSYSPSPTATAPALDPTCVQQRLAFSVGVSPIGVEVRGLVAWMAGRRETNDLKPIDKAIFGMVSESPGRNASEPIGGPVTNQNPEAEPSRVRRRQHGLAHPDRHASPLRRGGRGSTVTRTR
jgi:hypothetical protein